MAFRSSRWMFSTKAISRTPWPLVASSSRTTTGTRLSPACCAARHLRSPATISYAPSTRRTTIGWMTPCALMEAARSSRRDSSTRRRGCSWLGRRRSTSSSVTAGRCSGASGIKALSPFPRALRFGSAMGSVLYFGVDVVLVCLRVRGERAAITLRVRLLHTASLHACGAGRLCAAADHLLGETHVGGRAPRLHVVEQDRLAVAWCLGEAHVARNCGLEDLFLEEFP